MKTNKLFKLLKNEIVLCIDMDGTLTKKICWTVKECLNAKANTKVIDLINKLYDNKFIIIYTARRDKLIPVTMEWLRRNNIRYHAISNLKTPGFYIDDKCLNVNDI